MQLIVSFAAIFIFLFFNCFLFRIKCCDAKGSFHALLEERFVLNSYSLKAKKYFSTTLDYYNRKFWDVDDGFSSSPTRHYWKDDQFVTLTPNTTSNLCFNRLHAYTCQCDFLKIC
jgi:hypothetical protein